MTIFTELLPTIRAHVYSWSDDPLHQARTAVYRPIKSIKVPVPNIYTARKVGCHSVFLPLN